MIKFFFILIIALSACHHHHHHDHDHEEAISPISYTLQKENVEAFVELTPPVLGKTSAIEVTLSQIQPLQALTGTIELLINKTKKQALPSIAKGIYRTTLSLPDKQPLQLTLSITTDSQTMVFPLPVLPVAPTMEAAKQLAFPNKDAIGSITFIKSDMWNNGFALSPVQKQPIGQIIHTSGSIEPATSNLITMVAKRDGIVSLRKKNITSGTAVKAGELLFSVMGKGIVSDDLEMNFVKAQSNLERQKANLARKRQLLEEQIIGQKEFEETLNAYQVVKAEFENIKKVFDKGARRHLVTAPNKGFISQIGVQEGEFVVAGQRLGTLLQTSRLQVKVDISPRYGSLLPLIVDANFINPYNNQAYSLDTLEGRILSFGKMTSHEEGHYLPLYFEVNNHPDLLPGTLVEVYLMTQANSLALTIPQSAVLEEMGSSIVFVQRSGNTFDKQVVQLGITDGEQVQVLEGLEEGDYVVSAGALQIKLAAMTGKIDPHAGHNH